MKRDTRRQMPVTSWILAVQVSLNWSMKHKNGVGHDSLPNNFLGWLYLGNLSSFPHFGHLKPSTLPASHPRSSEVGCTGPMATVLVPQFAQIGLSNQWKNLAEVTEIDKLLQFQKYYFLLQPIYLGGKFNNFHFNRFCIAVQLFRNRSDDVKMWWEQKSGTQRITTEYVPDVHTTF